MLAVWTCEGSVYVICVLTAVLCPYNIAAQFMPSGSSSGNNNNNNNNNVLLTQYCASDKIEKNEMGWACGSNGGE